MVRLYFEKLNLVLSCSVLFFFSFGLFAEDTGFAKKGFLLEMTGGSANAMVNQQASAETTRNLFFAYNINPLWNSPNVDRKNLALYQAASFESSKIVSRPTRVLVEYNILKYLSFGISYNQSLITVTNVLAGDYVFLPFLGVTPDAPKNQPPELSNYFSFVKREINDSVGSLDVNLRLHYPISIFDPYLLLGVGKGVTESFGIRNYEKTSAGIGLRVMFYDPFYFVMEGFINDYRGNLGRSDFLGERGFRFGVGSCL